MSANVAELIAQVREANPDIPCAIGFGISTPEQARNMAKLADGVIVGSAIVRQIAKHGTNSVEPVCTYMQEMAKAAKGE